MQKYVSEPYLVEAMSFTEAEQRFNRGDTAVHGR